MLGIWQRLIDLIFPPPCSVVLLRTVTPQKFATKLQPNKVTERITALASYQDPVIRAAVTANKFHDYKIASALLATLLDRYLEQHCSQHHIWLVPIPLGRTRQLERGYNQVTRILEEVKHPRCVVHHLLTRQRETVPQTSLNRADRLRNLQGAFGALPQLPPQRPGTVVILVDDVTTTGATLKAARATLAPHLPPGTPLTCLALAH